MRIAVTAQDKDLDADFDPRFESRPILIWTPLWQIKPGMRVCCSPGNLG
jgi:hypothetical protein